MAIKKLLKEGITYNSLITIFEECCSFLDFYETMKSYGIERKVAKVIALHFSGKGLENQGARQYSKLHEEKQATCNSTKETTTHQANGDHPLQCDISDSKEEPKASPVKKQPDSKSSQVEGCEDWEREVAMSAPRKNFSLKCTTATPLSLDVDDFSSAQSTTTKAKVSPREKHQDGVSSTGSKIGNSRSETNESRTCNNSKKSREKTTQAEVKGRTSRSKESVVTKTNDKGAGKLGKSLKQSKLEGRTKKEAVVSVKGIKEKTPKPPEMPEERPGSPGRKDNKLPVHDSPVGTQGSLSKVERQFQGSHCDQNRSSGEDSPGNKQNKSQSTVTPDIDCGLSMTDVVEKFASVYIGDIAILVPIEESGGGCNSNETELGEPGSGVQEQAENTNVVESDGETNTLPTSLEPSSDALKPAQIKSAHVDIERHVQDQGEKDSVTKCQEVVDTDKVNSSICEKLVDNKQLSADSDNIANQTESSFQSVRTSDDSNLKDVNNMALSSDNGSGNNLHLNDNIPKADCIRNVTEEADCKEVTLDCENSVSVQDPSLLEKNESSHSVSTIGGTGSIGMPWKELQQFPHAPLSEEGSDQAVPERFVMSEGLACHVMNTDDMDHTRHDLQAELSSESSSTSGESMDAFSRQPPLGAERGFTPDTVQQQPEQLVWEGTVNDAMYSAPLGHGVSYPREAFPSYGNLYGTFHQAQQVLPLLKPYYSTFGYASQIRHIAPNMIQPQQQVFMPPYLQYRNQMMFSNAMPTVAGFPSTMQPSHFRPQVYQVWQGPTGLACSPVSFYGNPYDQTQESTSGVPDVGSTQPNAGLSHINSAVDYQNSIVDTSISITREESGSGSPSTASSASPFELLNASARSSSFHPVNEHSTLNKESFSAQTENDPGYSVLEDKHNEFKGKEIHEPGSDNTKQVVSLAQLCYNEVSYSDKVHLHKVLDNCDLNNSQAVSMNPSLQVQEDLVHRQVTILSREENAVAMGRRLSPDGSSMDGVCYDSSSAQVIQRPLNEDDVPVSTCQDLRHGYSESGLVKDRGPSPKPQRTRGSRSRKNKSMQNRQPTSSSGLSSNTSPDLNPVKIAESDSAKNLNNSCEHGGQKPLLSNNREKADGVRRTVRFLKERVEHNVNSRGCEMRTSPQRVEERHEGICCEGSSQRHTEKRDDTMFSNPVHAKGNSRKRVFNHRTARPHTGKHLQKHASKDKNLETIKRTDSNNNSG